LTKSHSTADCQVKKECNKILAAQQINSSNAVTSGSQSGVSTGQLRHLTEEAFEDALELEIKDESDDVTSNDTNEVDLLYFSRVSNHYFICSRTENFLPLFLLLLVKLFWVMGKPVYLFMELEQLAVQ